MLDIVQYLPGKRKQSSSERIENVILIINPLKTEKITINGR